MLVDAVRNCGANEAARLNCVFRRISVRFGSFVLAALATFVLGSAAQAVTVRADFQGTLRYADGFTNSTIAVGQKIQGHFTYEEQQTGHQSFGSGNYSWDTLEIKNLDTGVTQKFSFSAQDRIIVGSSGQHIYAVSATQQDHVKQTTESFTLRGTDNSASIFGSNSLGELARAFNKPTVPVFDLHAFDLGYRGNGSWGDCAGFCSAGAHVSSISFVRQTAPISAVPVPAALPLMMLGLAGLGFAGRRRV